MTEILKTAKQKIANLGSLLGQKSKDVAESAVKVATGNDGQLGAAKKEISSRKEKIDKAVDDAVGMKHGGRVGCRPQRG